MGKRDRDRKKLKRLEIQRQQVYTRLRKQCTNNPILDGIVDIYLQHRSAMIENFGVGVYVFVRKHPTVPILPVLWVDKEKLKFNLPVNPKYQIRMVDLFEYLIWYQPDTMTMNPAGIFFRLGFEEQTFLIE